MFGIKVKVTEDMKAVAKAADKAAFRNFGHAARSIQKDAKQSIHRSPTASRPGTPPHTRRRLLPNAIWSDFTREDAVIGPIFSRVGLAGHVHEFGDDFHGQDYPERSYMLPALERAAPRFAGSWSGSIGQ